MKAAKSIVAIVVLAGLAGGAWMIVGMSRPATVLLTDATAAPVPGAPGTLAVYLAIQPQDGPDRMTGASSPEAGGARLAGAAGPAGLPIPGGARPTLAADGAHVVLEDVDGALEEGRLVPVTLTFERSAPASTRARIAAPQMAHAGMEMRHEVPDGQPAPALDLIVQPRGDTHVVTLEAEDFVFSEDQANGPHVPGTGHGHLYLDGLKLRRLYGTEAVIGPLLPGRYEVTVTLNTNDHRAYVVDGRPVSKTVEIEVR